MLVHEMQQMVTRAEEFNERSQNLKDKTKKVNSQIENKDLKLNYHMEIDKKI